VLFLIRGLTIFCHYTGRAFKSGPKTKQGDKPL
jgi:hypothetical protein